jgi:hypothetical protein
MLSLSRLSGRVCIILLIAAVLTTTPLQAPWGGGYAPDPFEEKEINKNKIKDLRRLSAVSSLSFIFSFISFFSS